MPVWSDRACGNMSNITALRIIALVAAMVLCMVVQGLDTASFSSSSCSDFQLQELKTLVADIRLSLEWDEWDTHASNESPSVLASCRGALSFDLSTVNGENEANCASHCIAWIESVVDTPTCGDREMIMYQRRMATHLTHCSSDRKARLLEAERLKRNSRLRGLAAGVTEERTLGSKGPLDTLLVIFDTAL